LRKKDKKTDLEDRPEKLLVRKKRNYIGWAVFLFTLSIVLISLTSVVFPAFVASQNSILQQLHDFGLIIDIAEPFETGIWTGPLLVSNLVVFGIVILYYKKKLPHSIKRTFEFIFNFEVSKRVAIISIVTLLAIYIIASAGELFIEEEWEDYAGVKQRVERWSIDQVPLTFETHLRYFFLWSSWNLFGLYTVTPFLGSIALLITTYFITKQITQKRFAGLVAFVLVLQSNTFLTYDTTVSYTNFWTLFFLLSLYMIYKFWPLTPLLYLLSIPLKPLTAIFLPMLLFFIYRSTVSRKQKILASIACAAIFFGGAVAILAYDIRVAPGPGPEGGFDEDDFWLGFTSFSYQLRFDGMVLLFILPLIVGLFIVSRKGFKQAESIMILIGWTLLTAPLLTGFTDLTTQPYRFVPLVVFFAMGVGILLSKKWS